jgi:predicted nucleic acid-binding protein
LTVYFDSGLITKWYLPERDSASALKLRDRFEPPSPLTHLHRLELANAWRLKIFRDELDPRIVELAQSDLRDDIRSGVWTSPDYSLSEVFSLSERLAIDHSAELGTRSLDILHVAAAQILGCSTLASGDKRQLHLATRIGLAVEAYRS